MLGNVRVNIFAKIRYENKSIEYSRTIKSKDEFDLNKEAKLLNQIIKPEKIDSIIKVFLIVKIDTNRLRYKFFEFKREDLNIEKLELYIDSLI